jgi:DNA mismatch repair protein MSH2
VCPSVLWVGDKLEVQSNQQLSAESVGECGFVPFLKSLAEKPETTIRIFSRGDYYTVNNEDAVFVAKVFFKTTTVVKEFGSGEKKLMSVALSKLNFQKFLRDLLLVKQYRVELYVKHNNKWQLSGKASPGNLQFFEEDLFGNNEMSDSLIVLSLKIATDEDGQRLIGVAFADSSLRQFHVCQFTDNDQFSNVEAILMQIGPKECLIKTQDCNAEGGKLRLILERSNILITERPKADFNSKDMTQDLNRLLRPTTTEAEGNTATSRPEFDLVHSMSSLACIVKYLELLSDESAFGQFSLNTFDLAQYMHLDVAAVKALNLFPTPGDGGCKTMCVSGLLNVCKTSQGQRLLNQWVKQPLVDERKINERLDLVEVFFDNTYRSNRGRADVGRGDENDERSKRGGRCRVRVCETEIVQTRDANAVGEAVSSSDGTRNY